MLKKKYHTAYFSKFLKPKKKFLLKRLGKNYDGGYLIDHTSLKETNTLISLGINDDWSFEKDFFKSNPNSKILCFDRDTSLLFLVKIFLKKIIFIFYYGFKDTYLSFIKIIDYIFFLRSKIRKKNIAGIVIEFHNIDLFLSDIKKFINKIDLQLIHIHANNVGILWNEANIIELSFAKKPTVINKKVTFPNKLDQPNIKNIPEIKIKFK